MWVRITNDDALVHKFVNLWVTTKVDIDPKEGVRVWLGDTSNFYTGIEAERISLAVELLCKQDTPTFAWLSHASGYGGSFPDPCHCIGETGLLSQRLANLNRARDSVTKRLFFGEGADDHQ